MKNATMWVIVAAALVVGVFIGYFVERNRAINTLNTTKMVMQKEIDDMKMKMNATPTTAMMDLVMTKGGVAVAQNGMTLYIFDKDTTGKSNCTGTCATTWPPYTVSGTAPATLPAHISTINRTDGTMQYAWDGKPLYFYSGDKKVGDTTGDGVGGVWHVVKG